MKVQNMSNQAFGNKLVVKSRAVSTLNVLQQSLLGNQKVHFVMHSAGPTKGGMYSALITDGNEARDLNVLYQEAMKASANTRIMLVKQYSDACAKLSSSARAVVVSSVADLKKLPMLQG